MATCKNKQHNDKDSWTVLQHMHSLYIENINVKKFIKMSATEIECFHSVHYFYGFQIHKKLAMMRLTLNITRIKQFTVKNYTVDNDK